MYLCKTYFIYNIYHTSIHIKSTYKGKCDKYINESRNGTMKRMREWVSRSWGDGDEDRNGICDLERPIFRFCPFEPAYAALLTQSQECKMWQGMKQLEKVTESQMVENLEHCQ